MSDEFNKTLVEQLLKTQKSERRWRNIRFIIWIIIILFAILMYVSGINELVGENSQVPADTPYVSLVRMDGMIAPGKPFSAQNMVPALTRAFQDERAKGVLIDINSGGGTPVQASIIYNTIMRLKHKYHKHVMIVGEDLMASGAFMVAMGGDKVFVNPNTIAGSIGVLTSGFGFVGGMHKLGITRRVFTSGSHKVQLDPFEPLKPRDVHKIKSILNQVHAYFISVVKKSRGKRLHGNPHELFSGDFWTGTRAKQLGLVDGFGDISTVMQSQFHVNHYKDYTPQPPLLQSFISGVGTELHKNLGADFTGETLRT